MQIGLDDDETRALLSLPTEAIDRLE